MKILRILVEVSKIEGKFIFLVNFFFVPIRFKRDLLYKIEGAVQFLVKMEGSQIKENFF